MTLNEEKVGSARGGSLGFCFGALALYFLDPRSGGRRRALIRDQMSHFARVGARRARYRLRGWGHGMVGFLSSFRGRLQSEKTEDSVLLARIYSRLGHEIRDCGGLILEVHEGRV